MNVAALGAIVAGFWSARSLSDRRTPPRPDGPPWHALAPAEVLTRIGSTPHGLSADDVAQRRVPDSEQASPNLASLVVHELANPLSVVLGAGGALSTVAGSVADGLLITGVLGFNALIGGVQRLQTERAISDLTAAMPDRAARVRRGDARLEVAAADVVTGDLISLEAGDVVPADARIVRAKSLEADESSLSGESVPVAKATTAVGSEVAVADRSSMVYAGTAVAAGKADAVVVATGADTEARRGADGVVAPVTGVEARLDELMRATIPATLAAGALLTGSSLLRGVPAREAVATGVSLAAAAVPEGLPFLATVAQSAAARRLAARGVLVRNPRVLEALGRVEVLCFDKTGTLTEGRLQVRSVSDGVTVDALDAAGDGRQAVLAAALRATPRRRSRKLPHPTDQAIVEAAERIEVPMALGAGEWTKTVSLPFVSDRGYHAVLGHTPDGFRLSVKGAPEVVLPRCVSRRTGGDVEELAPSVRARLDDHIQELAQQGLRVLAVAERAASGRADLDDARVDRLELLGFVAVADVVRASAAAPIDRLRRSGIAVVMLTGDHPETARSIGRELGLVDGAVVTGVDLDAMSDAELDACLAHATVFARVTPAHKVRIVSGYRRLGRTVAMTGDGANDAQAIRLADTGIAFGPDATPAARAAADLVIHDDGVEALIDAIVEGRAMWASVRDALALLLGGNLGEVLFATGAGLITGRSPLNARQLLAVNLLTDLAPALAIALSRREVDHIDLGSEGPESSLGSRLTRDIAVRAGATAAAATGAWVVARFTGTPTRASTVALGALVGAQLGQTVVVGSRSPLVLASSAVSVGALVSIVQTPGLSRLFGCRPLGPVGWSIVLGSATAGTVGAAIAGRFVRGRPASPAVQSSEPREIDLRAEESGKLDAQHGGADTLREVHLRVT
jgi:cation-transporting ATPase I